MIWADLICDQEEILQVAVELLFVPLGEARLACDEASQSLPAGLQPLNDRWQTVVVSQLPGAKCCLSQADTV